MKDEPPILEPDDLAFQERQGPIRLLLFDFDGVFTDNRVYVFQDGREAVRCTRLDGIGLRRLERANITPFIVSSEPNPVVRERAAKLRIGCLDGLEDKVASTHQLASKRGIDFSQIGFVGNDVNDIPLLRAVALPIMVADAHPDVWGFARYRTRLRGGCGAVREVCDAIGTVRGVEARYP
ncbi:MAG: HAD hydrolase family protein [Gammaproteobacteria bacterium]|nr:HAD hydrolase family protein [Gammaproteobacteria bacterium]